MRRKDLIAVGAVVLAAVVLLVTGMLRAAGNPGDTVIITVDGEEYGRYPVKDGPREITVTQEDGSVNVVAITENGVYMKSSTCHNQLCVQMGEVTAENKTYRPNMEYIICLPNRVTVKLAGEQE